MNHPPFRRLESELLWEKNDATPPIPSTASSGEEALSARPPPPRLHGFCSNLFASAGEDEGKGWTNGAFSREDVVASHAAFEEAFVERTGASGGMPCGRRIGPSPFTLPRAKLREMASIQSALSAGLAAVLKSWGKPRSRTRGALPLPSEASDALLRCAAFADGLPGVERPVGSFRPDVLIGDDGRLRVCEINARFVLNGYLVTAGCAEALHSMPTSSPLGSLGLGAVPATQSLVEELAGRFDPDETLFAVVGRERPNDLAVLARAFDGHRERGFRAPAVRYVRPSQLGGGRERGSLACATDDGTDDGTTEAVRQCILELHQDELLGLPPAVLDGLLSLSVASRCLNPVWTILLVHDKRALGVLRTLTAEELPDEDARRLLRDHVVPTTHLEGVDALERLLSTQHGLLETTLVAKPCLLGKGEGILMEKDFGTPASFVAAVAEAASRMMPEVAADGHGEAAPFPYVVQSYVRQESFNVLRPPSDDPDLTPVAWHVVATMLCLDDQFLGPGIFRSSEKDIVALCNGGVMLVPALALPCAPPRSRFAARTPRQVPADDVRTALVEDGIAMLHLDRAVSDPGDFARFVRDDLGGLIHRHSSAVGDVWTIRPAGGAEGGGARSHTAEPFLPHTDASYEPAPPRFFALSIVRADRGCGGLLGLASVEEAARRLGAEDFDVLRNTAVRWRRPTEFSKDGVGGSGTATMAPVLFSRRRARVRSDIIETEHLSERDERRFWAAYGRFYAHLEEMCHSSARLLPERTVILMDNQRFVHARTRIKDPRRVLLRIRFDFPQSPEVQSLLRAASAKGLGPRSDRLEDWPIQTKADYMASINSEFARRYRARGGLYWSPSGGTTSATKGAEACAVPSANVENGTMRDELVDLLCGAGAVPRDGSSGCCAVNLFASGGLYRSLEIFGDVFRAVDATHLPLGAAASDEDVLRCVARFGADTLCGWGSRILQLCEAARGGSGALASVATIIHGGEKMSATNLSLIKKACGGGVRVFGCYGSAEAGVFGASREGNDSEHETYAILADSVHVEIVDDAGTNLRDNEWGNIVVTNLKRKSVQPLVRFNMGDIGRLVNGGPGFDQALEVKGRSDGASAFRLTADADFMFWVDIEEVIEPLRNMAAEAGETCLAQIIVPASDTVTLAIFTSLPSSASLLEAANTCSVAFSKLVGRSGAAHAKAETRLLKDMSELIRSSRSQKLMLWVDRRK